MFWGIYVIDYQIQRSILVRGFNDEFNAPVSRYTSVSTMKLKMILD